MYAAKDSVVHSPYTPFFGDAFMAAHGAIGVMLVALLWWTFPKPSVARALLFVAIATLVTAPLLGEFLRSFGAKSPALDYEKDAMLIASVLVFAAMIALRRFAIAFAALVMAAFMLKLETWVQDSWSEICALHLVSVGIVLGLVRRRAPVDEPKPPLPRTASVHPDVLLFGIATLAAAFVAVFVLSRADGSADEWAYTWQASVFARGRAYAMAPACENAFQSFYVFESMGRLFSQYTPGWPLFMTPFVALHVPWLAGPFSHGLMAVGVARVARSAVRLDEHGTTARVNAAGWIAGLVATFGTTILLCGASRYPHVFVAALFAWAIEAMLVIRTPGLERRDQVKWGLVLGSCVALMGASRPADGVMLASGLGLYYAYCLLRRRIGMRAFLATAGGLAFFGGLVLVILRVQLGKWFTTGYSLNAVIMPWNMLKYGWPKPNEWRYALPLATGSYAWFPCSLALGWAGIASLRRGARPIIFILVVAFFAFELYYQYINLGRGYDWGYGPRYELPFVVHMAVGTGVAMAPLAENARRHVAALGALYAGGPMAICITAIVVTLVRLWPLLYPGIYQHVEKHDSLNRAIRESGIHDAVVMAPPGTVGIDPLDLTENYPIDLYPNQDVLIAIERKPEFTQCVRRSYPTRSIYRAQGGGPVSITPY